MLLEKGVMCNLLIAGLGGRSDDELDKFLSKNNKSKKYVKRLGYVSDNKMTALYLECLALVFPSTYEGFGVPVVEAYSLGVPVISSNAFSLKEVVGNGGVLIHPYNYQRFSSEMEKVLMDNSYRNKLIKKSRNEAKRFNWVSSIRKIVSYFDIVVSF